MILARHILQKEQTRRVFIQFTTGGLMTAIGCGRSTGRKATLVKYATEVSPDVVFSAGLRISQTPDEEWKGVLPVGDLWYFHFDKVSMSGIAHVRLLNGVDLICWLRKIPEPQATPIVEGHLLRNPICLKKSPKGEPSEIILEQTVGDDATIQRYFVPTKFFQTLSRGFRSKASPDLRYLLFLRQIGTGKYSAILSELGAVYKEMDILNATEGDPGSGLSFDYYWSIDSKFILFKGAFKDVDVSNDLKNKGLNIIYDIYKTKYYIVKFDCVLT